MNRVTVFNSNKRTFSSNRWSRMMVVAAATASTTLGVVAGLSVGVVLALHVSAPDPVLDGTELLFAFMVFRHGDRTPEAWMEFPRYGDETAIRALIQPWGYGQLTNAGIRTAFKTGEFIRRRYRDILPGKYNASEVYIRSTDYTRTKMSALSAMAAAFPPAHDSWSRDIHWVPVPYTTVPAKQDFMLGYPSCPTWVSRVHDIMESPTTIPGYETIIEKTANILNDKDLPTKQTKVAFVNDIYLSLTSLGLDVGSEVRALLPAVAAAAASSWDLILEDDLMVQLEAGVLLNEFLSHANKTISGEQTPRVRIYSGHDLNLYSLEAALQVERQGVPGYGSLLALELRRELASGRHVVALVYLPDPHKEAKTYLKVKHCGVLCDYNAFYNLTKKFVLDENTWRIKCNITDDSDVTISRK